MVYGVIEGGAATVQASAPGRYNYGSLEDLRTLGCISVLKM